MLPRVPVLEGILGLATRLSVAVIAEVIQESEQLPVATIDLLDMEEPLHPAGYRMRRSHRHGERWALPLAFLRSRANSIEGGTTENTKGVLAERSSDY